MWNGCSCNICDGKRCTVCIKQDNNELEAYIQKHMVIIEMEQASETNLKENSTEQKQMEKEIAIHELELIKKGAEINGHTLTAEALGMAIDALKNKPN